MSLHQPDPQYLRSPRARANFRMAFRFALVLVGCLWVTFAIDALFGFELNRFGLRPRSFAGLLGVATAPLLHGGLAHIFNNSMPLLVALTAMFYLYPNAALRVIPAVWLGSGVLAWLIGRPSIHIGASGLLYGLLVFVFLSGILRRDARSVSVSLLVWFLYSTMIWGVLPIRAEMSWEMHLCGALTGALLAWIYRHTDRVPLKRYAWESDDTVPEWYPEAQDDKFELGVATGKDADERRSR
jgi:membrane associated rhomboid family serine protease